MDGHRATSIKIARDQVQRLTAQAVLGISATALNSTVLATVLIGAVAQHKVLFWLSLSLSVCLVRIFIQSHFQKKPLKSEDVVFRRNTYLFLQAISGTIWGVVPVFLFPHASVPHQVLIAFVLGGMVAGSVGVFASIISTFYAFSLPIIMPLVFVLLSQQDKLHVAMGGMIALFGLFMLTAARRLNREIHNFLVLKHENIALITSLEKEISERQSAEKALKQKNQQIESIVEARTSELRQVNHKLLIEIDDRIEAEKALRESEEKFRELANSLPQMVFETDGEGIITFANQNTFELLAYSQSDFDKGINALDVFVADKNPDVQKKIFATLKGKKLEGHEYLARSKSGHTFPVEIHATPVMKSDKAIGMRGIIINLTEKKRVEEEQKKLAAQLQRAQKMEVLGTMAGGVAHDLNNILSGIVSYPDLLLMQLPHDSSLRKPIQIMQDSGKKASAIVQDLLTLTRRGVVAEEVLNLNDVINAYLRSPEHDKLMSFHPNVHVEVCLGKKLHDIIGSRVHLIKTVMNLVSNAAEAMPNGGSIQITSTNRYLDAPVRGYDAIEEGDYTVLTVKDNGIGISLDDIDRIFEPFFTKKIMGRSGTGLGMAVVWGTVKDHKGYIDVDSVEGQGARFSLFFPVTRHQRCPIETPDPISSYHGNGESVLLVDDVIEQREIASDMLSQLGYLVTVVASGEEAVDYLRNHTADVIVLDMIMDPGMDGLDTFKKSLAIHPGQKAVIASGFSETDRVKEALRLGAGPYLKKPYTWVKLGQAVKAALGKEEQPLPN